MNNPQIRRRLAVSVRLVRRWRNRFAAKPTLRTLRDLPRSGRPPEVPLDVRARLISLACSRVDDDKTPFRVLWSLRWLQQALEVDIGVRISVSEIGHILRNAQIRPHRVRMWLNSQDPEFATKCRRVCQYYVSPPSDTTVLRVDEKRLFAHDYKPGLQPPGRHAGTRREYQWSRNGSSVLLAAFDVASGKVYGECRARRTAEDLVAFMEAIAARTPGKVVVIWDNLNVHFDDADARWTTFNERHGDRVTFVLTPKHASWLNQVECWFSILERRILRHASSPMWRPSTLASTAWSSTGTSTRLTPSTGCFEARLGRGAVRIRMSDFGPEAMAGNGCMTTSRPRGNSGTSARASAAVSSRSSPVRPTNPCRFSERRSATGSLRRSALTDSSCHGRASDNR